MVLSIRIQATPLHNMLSERTLGLVDYHVQHASNANIGFIDWKAKIFAAMYILFSLLQTIKVFISFALKPG